MAAVDTEVVVIGAGMAGLATAYELAQGGRDVTVLEQFAVGHRRGSSHGASRVFRLSYPDAGWVRLAQDALREWRRWEAETGGSLLRLTGSLDVGPHVPQNRGSLDACGVTSEVVAADAAMRRFGLRLDDGEPALFQPDAGVLSAARVLEHLGKAIRARGGRLAYESRVEQLHIGQGVVRAHTPSGPVTGRAAVVAAGPWAGGILAPLGLAPPVTVTRETVAYLSVDRADELPVLMCAGGPGVGDDRVVGTYALADAASILKVGVHHTGPEADPAADIAPDPVVAEWAVRWAADRLPGRGISLARSETCHYTNTTDERFVLERHGRVVVGSACSGHAFKFAPVIGATLAGLAVDAVHDSPT
ncbi:MAG: FAD-dependent oxidoreductase [Thermoleophilia bacterium]|nr:FAD-dependent oxidoreductase [Thermoleophilia bacterium]